MPRKGKTHEGEAEKKAPLSGGRKFSAPDVANNTKINRGEARCLSLIATLL
jgi:hypothetical protein